jgi:hypothetical protein
VTRTIFSIALVITFIASLGWRKVNEVWAIRPTQFSLAYPVIQDVSFSFPLAVL